MPTACLYIADCQYLSHLSVHALVITWEEFIDSARFDREKIVGNFKKRSDIEVPVTDLLVHFPQSIFRTPLEGGKFFSDTLPKAHVALAKIIPWNYQEATNSPNYEIEISLELIRSQFTQEFLILKWIDFLNTLSPYCVNYVSKLGKKDKILIPQFIIHDSLLNLRKANTDRFMF
jgi:hypothetical protein